LRRPWRIDKRSVLLEAFLIGEVAIPGDICRQPVAQQHPDLLGRQEPLPPFRAPGRRILRAFPVQSVSVGPCIDRVMQHAHEERDRRQPPFPHLWALGYDDMARADQVRGEITELGWGAGKASKYLLLEDIAVVARHPDGRFTLDRK